MPNSLYDSVFDDILGHTRDVTPTWDLDLGGLAGTMHTTTRGMEPLVAYAREAIERHRLAPGEDAPHPARLVSIEDWVAPVAREFRRHVRDGRVAAVDATPLVSPRRYLAGHVFAVAVGALTAQRPLVPRAQIVSTAVPVRLGCPPDEAPLNGNVVEVLGEMAARSRDLIVDTTWPDAFQEYQVRRHAVEEVSAPYVLVDGPLAPESLSGRRAGRDLLERLLHSPRVFVGVVKSMETSPFPYRLIARALRPGEAYVVESQARFLLRDEQHRYFERWIEDELDVVWRGVYRPGNKAYGFQCRAGDFQAALALLWVDRDDLVGHEIPFLLNQVDAQLRHRYAKSETENALTGLLAEQGEEFFFDESNERMFR